MSCGIAICGFGGVVPVTVTVTVTGNCQVLASGYGHGYVLSNRVIGHRVFNDRGHDDYDYILL